jgi:hypothetical protein
VEVSDRQRAHAVLLRALAGNFSIEDFHKSWPDSDDPLLGAIADETEDTVEHAPGGWLTRGVNKKQFQKSSDYKVLLIDAQLLSTEFAEIPSSQLISIRNEILATFDLNQVDESLTNAVRNLITQRSTSESSN